MLCACSPPTPPLLLTWASAHWLADSLPFASSDLQGLSFWRPHLPISLCNHKERGFLSFNENGHFPILFRFEKEEVTLLPDRSQSPFPISDKRQRHLLGPELQEGTDDHEVSARCSAAVLGAPRSWGRHWEGAGLCWEQRGLHGAHSRDPPA